MQDDTPILRPAARVLLIDAQERVLLLRANVGDGDVWITPGGALETGETPNAPRVVNCGKRRALSRLS